MCAAGEEAGAGRPQSQTSLRVFSFAVKSRIVSRRPTALLSPFVSEPQSQSACKIDELVHGWVTMGDSQSEGRGGGEGLKFVCQVTRLHSHRFTHLHFQLTAACFAAGKGRGHII